APASSAHPVRRHRRRPRARGTAGARRRAGAAEVRRVPRRAHRGQAPHRAAGQARERPDPQRRPPVVARRRGAAAGADPKPDRRALVRRDGEGRRAARAAVGRRGVLPASSPRPDRPHPDARAAAGVRRQQRPGKTRRADRRADRQPRVGRALGLLVRRPVPQLRQPHRQARHQALRRVVPRGPEGRPPVRPRGHRDADRVGAEQRLDARRRPGGVPGAVARPGRDDVLRPLRGHRRRGARAVRPHLPRRQLPVRLVPRRQGVPREGEPRPRPEEARRPVAHGRVLRADARAHRAVPGPLHDHRGRHGLRRQRRQLGAHAPPRRGRDADVPAHRRGRRPGQAAAAAIRAHDDVAPAVRAGDGQPDLETVLRARHRRPGRLVRPGPPGPGQPAARPVDRAADQPPAARGARARLRRRRLPPQAPHADDHAVQRVPALLPLRRRVEGGLHPLLRPALRADADRRAAPRRDQPGDRRVRQLRPARHGLRHRTAAGEVLDRSPDAGRDRRRRGQGAAAHVRPVQPRTVRPAARGVDPPGDDADEQPVREQARAGRERQPGRAVGEVGQVERRGRRRALPRHAQPPAARGRTGPGGLLARRGPPEGRGRFAVGVAEQAGFRVQLL
ncbi:MAG: hypothetical protein AVDCRST_MAG64-278, partial [uncultured Phycisphaerae bacterium]